MVQFNLDLVTTCDLVPTFQDYFSIYFIKTIYLVTLCDLVTFFSETKSVTKSRVHCTQFWWLPWFPAQNNTCANIWNTEYSSGCQFDNGFNLTKFQVVEMCNMTYEAIIIIWFYIVGMPNLKNWGRFGKDFCSVS